uniref:Uncharacterized protein n=1 Tax=viral metagenome TaxID=1070528 RepID=A0A6C0K6G1_9ZZZZ
MNRLLDLPEDILVLIYKWVFKECAKQIDNKNARSLYDFYDMLKKSKLCYCINMDDRDERDDTNSIYLYRRLYIKEDSRLYKIIYIEYPISFVCADFEYIRTIIEEFASIIYNDDNEDRNLRNLHRCRSGIYNLEYTRDTIRVYIDKNKLRCRVDLENAIIMGYELIYYSLKLINILELNAYDVYGDIDGLFEWLEDYNLLLGYTITNDVVAVELGG